MVRCSGWTATSRGEAPYTPLNEFVRYFDSEPNNNKNYPEKRSGHRCFTDNDYFYMIGGYCTNKGGQNVTGHILKELWVMSLVTFEWRRYEVRGSFPDSLASFALVQLAPFSNSILLFGGSGTHFGVSSSNTLYLVRVNNEECFATSEELQVEGEPPNPIYGHAMCAGEVSGKYYIVGGTEGTIFNFDVTSVTMQLGTDANGEKKTTWHYKKVSMNEEYAGRYRLEVVYDELLSNLIFFGGGNGDEVFGFDKLIAMNVRTNVTEEIAATPDQVHGFPKARRCHTLVRHNRNVIITGGVRIGFQLSEEVYSDVWVFDLDTFAWTKLIYSLPEKVFFHDSVMTRDGWFLTFGGVNGTENGLRNNMLCGAWFDVPRLQRFAIERLRHSNPKLLSGLYCGNFRLSNALDIVMVFLKKGKVEEKEKHIIAQSKIKFYEEVDRSRHYLNENAENYMIGG